MKKVNNLFIFLILILNTICLYKLGNNFSRLAPIISLYIVLFIPKILRKIFHLKIHPTIEFVYLVFIFLAQFLGSVVNLYKYFDPYDRICHGISGFLSGYVAIYLLLKFKHYQDKNFFFQCTYILGIVFLIAGVWEMLEFGFDTFLGMNTQHSLETGVRDTMEDMISAFLGSLVFLSCYGYEIKHQVRGITRKLISYME